MASLIASLVPDMSLITLAIKVIECIKIMFWNDAKTAPLTVCPRKTKGTRLVYNALWKWPPYLKNGIRLCIVAPGNS